MIDSSAALPLTTLKNDGWVENELTEDLLKITWK